MNGPFWRSVCLALLGLLAAGQGGRADETPPPPAAPQRTAANQRFHDALDSWRQAGAKLRQVLEEPADPKKVDERLAAIEQATDESNEKLELLWDEALKAFRADSQDREVAEFIPYMAGRLAAADRLERALEGVLLVAEKVPAEASLYQLIVDCAVNVGDVATARKFLRRGIDEKVFPPGDPEAFDRLDAFEKLLAEEAQHRLDDEQGEGLPRVRIVTTAGDLVVELFENDAPNAVANFLYLVDHDYYDSLPFFRVLPGFGATVGCPQGDGSGGAGYEIVRDTAGRRLPLRGTLCMLGTEKAVHGSQFFINFRNSNAEKLLEKTEVFGRIVDGLDVACRLTKAEPRTPNPDAPPDRILEIQVLRKREHEYFPETTTGIALQQVQKAVELAAQGRTDEAIVILEENLKLAPDQFETNFSLGVIYVALRRTIDAQRHFKVAEAARPNHAETHFQLGVLLAGQRKIAEAIEQFRDCIRFNPNDARAYNNLATLLGNRGEVAQGIELLERAVALAPDYLPAQDNLRKLRLRQIELEQRASKAGERSSAASPPAGTDSQGETP